MKLLLLVIMQLLLVQPGHASGCSGYNYLVETVTLKLWPHHIGKKFELAVENKSIKLTSKNIKGGSIYFRGIQGDHKLNKEKLEFFTQLFKRGEFQLENFGRENVLFTIENDCDGTTYNSTGRYLLSIKAGEQVYTFVYPSIEIYLDYYNRTDKLLPLFKR